MEDEDVEGTPGSSGSRPEAGRDGEEVSAISRAPKCARQCTSEAQTDRW